MPKKLTKLDEISAFLEEYQDLWWVIDQNDPPYPCMDVVAEFINDKNCGGYDFTGKYDVFQIFFLGQSDYFPAICNIKDVNKADMYPVYEIETEGGRLTYVGNFRKYVRTILKYCLEKDDLECEDCDLKEVRKWLKDAYKESEKFSKDVIDTKYKLKRARSSA